MTLIDILLKKGYSAQDAEKRIRAGYVKVDGIEMIIPGTIIKDGAEILIKESKKWVSRGAFKLIHAIENFQLDFNNKVVLDIGSSTGGFTQVALSSGASKVYALDVGTNQLDFSLRRNEKVITLEKTNLKTITKDMFLENIDIVVTDVSFISLREVFKVLNKTLEPRVQVMALIKPQYEAFTDQVGNKGLVDESVHKEIIERVISHAKNNNFKYIAHKPSSIKGLKSGNIEYISLFERN